MNEPIHVASVLLVASKSRRRRLLPWLGVVGEPVAYTLEERAPAELPECGPSWDVIVVDGESIPSDAARAEVLHRTTLPAHRFATTLYVCNRLPTDTEREQALAWADDVVEQGREAGDCIRRRVQAVALAPWRRACLRRLEAERRGAGHLRLVHPAREEVSEPEHVVAEPTTRRMRRLDRAQPLILADRAARLGDVAHKLVVAAFHEGRRVGVAAVQESAERICAALVDELEAGRRSLRPEDIDEMEARYGAEQEGSPVVAARFAGADGAIEAIRAELRRLALDELDAIERHDARPAFEP